MPPLFDTRCDDCEVVVEVSKAFKDEYICLSCGGNTKTLLTSSRYQRVRDPMDQVHKGMSLPDSSSHKIKSFGNDRRTGGKGYGPT